MKHTLLVTIFLVIIFVLAQVVGLGLIVKDAVIEKTASGIQVTHPDTAIGARPETTGSGSLMYVVIGIGLGTLLLLVLIRYEKMTLWKLWFFFAVWMATSISLGVLISQKVFFDYDIAIFLGLAVAYFKTQKPNVIMHNLSEILMYSGIALLLVPMFDLLWASILLVLIAFYDMYAVWKSEHMVEMAKFQTKSKLFAGLLIPYKMPKTAKQEKPGKTVQAAKLVGSSSKNIQPPLPSPSGSSGQKTAVLGGGDIAFPLIFSGVALEWLLRMGYTKSAAFLHANIITLFATIALIGLFIFAKKDKFYPAMPFLAAGCFIGLAVMWLLL